MVSLSVTASVTVGQFISSSATKGSPLNLNLILSSSTWKIVSFTTVDPSAQHRAGPQCLVTLKEWIQCNSSGTDFRCFRPGVLGPDLDLGGGYLDKWALSLILKSHSITL